MKTSLKRWIGRVPDLGAVVQRFPVPVILMGIFTLIIIFRDALWDEDQFAYVCGGLVLASYLLVSWIVGREAQGKPVFTARQVVFAGIVCTISWFGKDIYFNIPMAIAGAILLLGNSVRRKRSRDDLHVWDFTHKLWTGAIFATVGSIIFTLGIFSISWALKSLFGVNINELVEDLVLPFGLGFLAPLYWLSTLPPANENYAELYDNPGFVSKAVAFLGTWLLAPLILIYAVILLAYGAKILMMGEMPKGEVAQLTIPFLIIGALTWLVLEPPFVQDRWLAKLFRKIWFWLSIPVSILLGFAISIRVREYGLTEERILLILCVIWALGVGLWFSIKKQDSRDIRIIPGFAACLLLIASVTAPFLSVTNQASRVSHFMEKSGLISDSGVFLSESSITDKDSAKKAKGALDYLFRHREHDRIQKQLKKWDVSAGTDRNKVYKALSLEDIHLNSRFQHNIQYNPAGNSIDIAGFDVLYGEFYFNSNNKNERALVGFENTDIYLEDGKITIMTGGLEEAQIDLLDWMDGLKVENNKYMVENPRLFLLDQDGQQVAIQIKSLNNWNGDNLNGTFFLLVKGFKPKP